MSIVLLIIPHNHPSKQANDSLGYSSAEGDTGGVQETWQELLRTTARWGSRLQATCGVPCASPVAGALLTRRSPTLPSVNLHITENSFKTCSMIPWWVLTKSHSISLGVCEKGRLRHTRRQSCCFVRCTCVCKEMTWSKEISFTFLKFPLKQSE